MQKWAERVEEKISRFTKRLERSNEKAAATLWQIIKNATAIVALTAAGIIIIPAVGAFLYIVVPMAISLGANMAKGLIAIFSSFPIVFALLLCAYFVLFVLLEASAYWTTARWVDHEPIRFRIAIWKVLQVVQRNHNRWWYFFPIAAMITMSIAWAHPGSPLFSKPIDDLTSQVASNSTVYYFFRGNQPTAAQVVKIIATEGTWFWWHATWVLWTISVISIPFIFFKEVFEFLRRAGKAYFALMDERRKTDAAERIAQASVARAAASSAPAAPPAPTTATATVGTGGTASAPGGPTINVTATTIPPPAPIPQTGSGFGWGKLISAGVISEILIAGIHGWLDINRMRRGEHA